ncbi:MAG: hypothetical protein ABII19_01770 [Patescibacteria group bacterium]
MKEGLTMKTTMIALFGFVSVFASGCYDSYRNYSDGSFPIETCEIVVTVNVEGATIAVDDIVAGGTVELGMGFHVFAAAADGYFPASTVVEVDESCAPVELQLRPDLSGDYDLVLHNRIYDRLLLHLDQDVDGHLVGYDWYPDRPDHIFQEFTGTVTADGEVHLLSDDSVRMELSGQWTPPGVGGVSRIVGTWTSAPGGGGDWLAESRP